MKETDFSSELVQWYESVKRDLPWRRTSDPYAIWVSEIMLQQTRAETVKPYFTRFLTELPTVKDLANADDELLYKLWQGLGYYSRVRNMKRTACFCMEHYSGNLPDNYESLRKLCGIGNYTAGAIASFAFGERVPAIDGNVLRVLSRYLLIDKVITSPAAIKEIRTFLDDTIPKKDPGTFNQALIELGATLCGPDKAARCGGCPLLLSCAAFRENKTDVLPVKAEKQEKKLLPRTPLILLFQKSIALEKRPSKGLLANLWEPPTMEGHAEISDVQQYVESRGARILNIRSLPPARHIFTHLIWEMKGYEITLNAPGDFTFFERDPRKIPALPSAFKAYSVFFNEQCP